MASSGCSVAARASLVAEHRLWGTRAAGVTAPGLYSTDAVAVHIGFVALGRVGSSWIRPTSPALAGGFFTTEPPGKPCYDLSDSSHPRGCEMVPHYGFFKNILFYLFIFVCQVSLAAHRLSCPVAGRSLVPRPRFEPASPAL